MDESIVIKRAWDTCIELIEDREYLLKNEYKKITENDLKYIVSNNKNLDIIASNTDNSKKIYVKFILNIKVKPSLIKEIVEEIKKEIKTDNLDIILVVSTKPNNPIVKLTKEITRLQIMWLKQLQFNPTKHYLVPKHIKLNNDEIDLLMKKFSLQSKNLLPLLSKDDVISRYYNYKSGDIIKIINTSSSQNCSYEFFRCVR
uniref:RNA polymerase subunit H/Rpb5 C-terminal domain-containing protein n=1 Tax=viral metagenome TaxID=1070528 RepID=A0A6C0JEK3_9ZZZZ